jgi:2-hydroxy-6-oxonona-2,4-dienedioate hydrolase
MTRHAGFPDIVATLADARAVERLARRYETTCGDGKMVWHVWGEGPPIVLVHGGSGSWNHWVRNIAPLVESGRTVYAPDLPGCGGSARPPFGEDGDVLPPWIETGLQELIGAEPVDLVGFSFGAMVSGFFAAQYPARVRKLVLVGAPALSSTPTRKLALKEWLRLPDGADREAAFLHNLRMLMVARDETVDELALTLYVESLKRDRLTKRRLAGTDILLRTLPDVRCPVWSVWGADDALYIGRRDVAVEGMEAAPHSRWVTFVPRAGHWVQFEQADIFNRLLRTCLEG